MSSEKKGFNFIYLPSRGDTKHFFVSSVWLFLGLVVIAFFGFFSIRVINNYQFYKSEYVKISGLSLEETEKMQLEELTTIENELEVIYAVQEKNIEKMTHISNADSQNRESLKLASLDLNPDDLLSDITKYQGYFNNSNLSLQAALSLEEKIFTQTEQFDQIITNNEVLSLASANFLEQWEKTPLGYPLPGIIDPGFGYRIHPVWHTPDWHTGVDITGYYGQPIKATAKGKVIKSEYSGGYGNCVIIYHRDGISTLYAHNSENLVHEGDIVERGQIIAKAGKTGTATCVHTHYEVRVGSEQVDPEKFNSLVGKYVPK